MEEQGATILSLPEAVTATILTLATGNSRKTFYAVRLTCSGLEAEANRMVTKAYAHSDEQLAVMASKFPNLKALELRLPDHADSDCSKMERREITRAAAAQLCRISGLASLKLWCGRVRLNVSRLRHMQNLTRIDFSPRSFSGAVFAGLHALETQLKSLRLSGMDAVPDELGRLLVLRSLVLSDISSCPGMSFLSRLECLETLKFEQCKFQLLLPELCHLGHLRSVEIEACGVKNMDVFGPSLTALEITLLESKMGDFEVPQRLLPGVKELALCNYDRYSKPIALAAWVPGVERLDLKGRCLQANLQGLRHLKNLNNRCRVDATVLQALRGMTTLQVLCFDCSKVFDVGPGLKPTSLRDLNCLAALRVLHVYNMTMLEEFADLSGLRSLSDLAICNSCSWPFGTLNGLTYATALTRLRLIGLYWLDGIPSLAGLDHLQYMDIAGCNCVKCIPGLEALGRLAKLHLSGLPPVKALDGLEMLTSLERLVLTDMPYLTQIPSLARLHALRELHIEDCKNLKAVPGLEGRAEHIVVQRQSLAKLLSLRQRGL